MIEVRWAQPGDVEAIAYLMEELNRFYGVTSNSRDQWILQITASLFQDPKASYVLLAWDGEQLVGMAAYSFLWPAAGVTRSLYLKELYVREVFRRKGIGTQLMRRLHQVASEYQCSRIEWTTDTSNDISQAFYERLGMQPNKEKDFYRLDRDVVT